MLEKYPIRSVDVDNDKQWEKYKYNDIAGQLSSRTNGRLRVTVLAPTVGQDICVHKSKQLIGQSAMCVDSGQSTVERNQKLYTFFFFLQAF